MSVLNKIKAKKSKSTYKKGFLTRSKSYPTGRYGLELEVEGRNILMGGTPRQWVVHNDGSLRGDSAEYVLAAPLDYEQAVEAINNLFTACRANKMTFNDSNRTSFHVHLNTYDFNIVKLANVITLYGIFENLLVNWCGPYRVGNLFAQRLCDVKWGIRTIANAFRENNFGMFSNEVRYMGLNMASINKFGSLEFRSMRGITRPEDGVLWLRMINKILEASDKFDDPFEIIADFSGQELRMAHKVFGTELSEILVNHTRAIGEDPLTHLWDGVRQMQEIAYAVDWASVRQELKQPYVPNPFELEDKPKKRSSPGASLTNIHPTVLEGDRMILQNGQLIRVVEGQMQWQ